MHQLRLLLPKFRKCPELRQNSSSFIEPQISDYHKEKGSNTPNSTQLQSLVGFLWNASNSSPQSVSDMKLALKSFLTSHSNESRKLKAGFFWFSKTELQHLEASRVAKDEVKARKKVLTLAYRVCFFSFTTSVAAFILSWKSEAWIKSKCKLDLPLRV